MRLSMQRLSSPLLELNGFKCLAVSVALLCVGLLNLKDRLSVKCQLFLRTRSCTILMSNTKSFPPLLLQVLRIHGGKVNSNLCELHVIMLLFHQLAQMLT